MREGLAFQPLTLYKFDQTTGRFMKHIALIFSGQGAQHVGMGKDLAEAYPHVMDLYNKADEVLGFDLKQTCFEGPPEKLTNTDYCQPALFLHGYALLTILREKIPGFIFEATAGLSLGEFTAHTAAGTFSFEDGLKIVAERGKLMQEACEASDGGMVSLIGASHEKAEEIAGEAGLEVANYNCPGQIVLSGEKPLIPKAIEISRHHGIRKAVPLNVAGAYHSRLMKPAQDKLAPTINSTAISPTNVHIASNVTGQLVIGEEEIRRTLIQQVTGSVRWESCIHTLLGSGVEHFVELGPGKILQGLCRRIDSNIECISIANNEDLEDALDELK